MQITGLKTSVEQRNVVWTIILNVLRMIHCHANLPFSSGDSIFVNVHSGSILPKILRSDQILYTFLTDDNYFEQTAIRNKSDVDAGLANLLPESGLSYDSRVFPLSS